MRKVVNLLKENNAEFTGNAKAIVDDQNDIYACLSYETVVCSCHAGKFIRHWGGYSVSTMRHVKMWANEYCPDLLKLFEGSKHRTFKSFWESLPLDESVRVSF